LFSFMDVAVLAVSASVVICYLVIIICRNPQTHLDM
jgi:hypothetical protein